MRGNAVEDGRDTSRVEVMHMAGDFEFTIAAVQHGRTAERRSSALADKARRRSKDRKQNLHATHKHKEGGEEGWKGFWERTEVKDQQARSLEQWKCKVYEFVWVAQARKYIRRKKIDSGSKEERERMIIGSESKEEREKMIKAMKINKEKKIDEKMKNMKAILKKMIENKKLMKKKVDKDKEAARKTTASKSKSKRQNKGKGRSKRE